MTLLDDAQLSRRQALRGFAGGLAVLGLGGGLAACGDSGGGGSTAGGGGSTVEAWIYRPEYKQAIGDIVDAFQRANPDITVDMQYKPTAQYNTVLKTALVGGSAPDAIATNGASGIWGDVGADGGYIKPLDGVFPLDGFDPSVRSAITYRGRVYGAPVQMFRIGLYYQKPIFEQHGLQAPRTWDDLMDVSRRLKDAGVTPMSIPAQDMIIPFFFYHLGVNSILGADSESDLASGRRKLTDPELVRAAQFMVDMAPYFNEGFEAVAYAEGKALFAQGQAAMTIGGSSDYAGYVEVNPKVDVGFFGFPSPAGALPPNALNGLSMAYTVNKRSKVLPATERFVAWLTSEPAQKLVLRYLGLPSRNGIEPTGSDARSVVLRTILGVDPTPSWLDYPATGNVYTKLLQDGSGIFSGKLSPQQFAAMAQSQIKVAGS